MLGLLQAKSRKSPEAEARAAATEAEEELAAAAEDQVSLVRLPGCTAAYPTKSVINLTALLCGLGDSLAVSGDLGE